MLNNATVKDMFMRVLTQENRIFIKHEKSDGFWFLKGMMVDGLTLKKFQKFHSEKIFHISVKQHPFEPGVLGLNGNPFPL